MEELKDDPDFLAADGGQTFLPDRRDVDAVEDDPA